MNSLIFDRRNEKNFCQICKKTYDTNRHVPYCLIPCGHTFCHKCVKSIEINVCPTCEMPFNQFFPDYAMIDIVKGVLGMKIEKQNENLINEINNKSQKENLSQDNQQQKDAVRIFLLFFSL